MLVPLLYWLGAMIGSRLTMTPEGVSVLWPANAVLLAALVHYRGRGWWVFATGAMLAELAVDLPRFSLGEALAFGGTNVVEASIAWLLLEAWRFDPSFEHVADVGKFVLAGPMVGALVGATTGTLLLGALVERESTLLDTIAVWWFGDGLGLLVLTPLCLSFRTPAPHLAPPMSARPLIDALMTLGGVVALGMFVVAENAVFLGMHLRPILLLPFVLYAAVRLSFRWVCVLVFVVALVFVALTLMGRSTFGWAEPSVAVVWMQEFLFILIVSTLGLSSLLTNVRIRDSELLAVNRLLRQRAGALEQSIAELRRIAFVAAHDLQTPLRSISSFTQLLGAELQGRVGLQAEDWIRRVTDNTRRLEALLRDLGRIASIDAREVPFEPVDTGRVVDEVVRDLSDTIRDADAVVTRGELPVVPGDREQLEELVKELICNATKYRGTAPLTIHIGARAGPTEWEFSVRDNGVGIPAEAHERVFELFQRLPATPEVPGTGLGLALCARVVHRHGGRIWIESEPGVGCTVHFTLPREAAA